MAATAASGFATTRATALRAAAACGESVTRKLLTLIVVTHNDDEIILGMKKRGFGRGKWNGFGGKVEAGETVLQGALRELDEEACIKGKDAKQTGRLLFEFKDDPVIMDVRVFRVTSFEGTPTETEEMRPNSFKVSDIPYDSMWADDRHWLPHMLSGKSVRGYFLFDKDSILDGVLEMDPKDIGADFTAPPADE